MLLNQNNKNKETSKRKLFTGFPFVLVNIHPINDDEPNKPPQQNQQRTTSKAKSPHNKSLGAQAEKHG
jgi:hypothetical protein